uniref:Uncharacterized protein n=1 Tax=Aureoumbra lagunensis TaxID=44058 RepID=A0A6S8EW20_9STRA|mmetsp:Transcript_46/g.79  ORF Transcript_46/g.79 Transcript_46/m.79 type:complete len:466 (+) Transcript_46:164-1561(+)
MQLKIHLFFYAFGQCLRGLASDKGVGVCWTLTEVQYNPTAPDYGLNLEDFKELLASYMTLMHGNSKLKTCIFTELPEHVLKLAIDKTSATHFENSLEVMGGRKLKDFTYVLASARGEELLRGIVNDDVANATKASLIKHEAHRPGLTMWTKFKALAARIQNLAHSPFRYTLFVDTDTAFCASPDLEEQLRALGKHADVRFVEQDASNGKFGRLHVALARELGVFHYCLAYRNLECGHCRHSWTSETDLTCSTCYYACGYMRGRTIADPSPRPCDTFQDRVPHFQIGAIATRSGPRLKTFVEKWLRLYIEEFKLSSTGTDVSDFGRPVNSNFANDQFPLVKLAKDFCMDNLTYGDWTMAHLPPTFNFRMFQHNSFGPVAGRVLMMHSHNIPELEGKPPQGLLTVINKACNLINGNNLGLRLISHGEIRKSTGEVSVQVEPLFAKAPEPSARNKRTSIIAGSTTFSI